MNPSRFRCSLLIAALLPAAALVSGGCSSRPREAHPPPVLAAASCEGDGCTSPAPVFQRGNNLMQPLADSDPGVAAFLRFYGAVIGQAIPAIARGDIAALPPRYLDIADNGQDPGSGHFNSSLVCQTCHDGDWTKSGTELGHMSYWAQGGLNELAANWSLFGDWSGSIKALAGRDPVFLAQVETARNNNPRIEGSTIDNLCFRCHSAMAQRQANADGKKFSHYMLYATPPGTDYENPFPEQPLTGSQYATYGALGRDGISCSVCHTIGPASGQPWNGTDYTLFYGQESGSVYGDQVTGRLLLPDGATAPPFPFTAHMETHPGMIKGPDGSLETTPMASLGLTLTQAEIMASQPGPAPVSYLRSAPMCGTCHVVVLPAVPAGYGQGSAIPGSQQAPYYKRPSTCPPGQTTFTGDPLTDPCVPLGYEQTTYFEWLNSGYAQSADNCLNCHMPTTRQQITDANPDSGVQIAQYNEDLARFYEGSNTLAYREYNRHTLVGINMFVLQMYQQFSDILGTQFYTEPGSLVPPYLQHLGNQGNLIANPGAENGREGWTNEWNQSVVTAVTQARDGADTITPHSGRFFFDSRGISTYSVDVSKYADLIGKGQVKAYFGGYVYTTKSSPQGWFQIDCYDSVKTDIGSFFVQVDPGKSGWQLLQKEVTVPPGTLAIHFNLMSLSGDTPLAGYYDDLYLRLDLPGSSFTPTDGDRSYVVANNLLNAEQSVVDLAFTRSAGIYDPTTPAVQIAVTDTQVGANMVEATVKVTNNVGHKFPTGAPFRRAFVQLEILDAQNNVLFASGQPNAVGAICKGVCDDPYDDYLPSEFASTPGQVQPHYQVITSEDQVQIYEVKAVDETGAITSRALSIFDEVKDNRLLPLGWLPPDARASNNQTVFGLDLLQLARLTVPKSKLGSADRDSALTTDPDYTDPARIGSDTIVYRVSLPSHGTAPKRVVARLNYQTIPPGYLQGRFTDGLRGGTPSPAVARMIYMVSRLNLNLGLKNHDGQDIMNNWTMVLAEDVKAID